MNALLPLLQFCVEAVADANRSIELDPAMAKAYFRKGLACIKLEEYETAKVALETGASLAPSDSRFTNMIKECEDRIAGCPKWYSYGLIALYASLSHLEESGSLPSQLPDKAPMSTVSPPGVKSLDETVRPANNVKPMDDMNQVKFAQSAKPKYRFRHEYYQKPDEVVVTIFAKGVPGKCVTVDFGEQILSVSIDVPGEDMYHFQPRLFGKIVPAKCRYDVLSTKVEIRLAKADAIFWASLEFSRENTVLQKINVTSGAGSQRPTYPSSKPRRVDWDKLEAQVKKEEKDEKLDGDAALNKFFREIYRDADEDTRRAMKKSFVESNGTVLSTNWKEVGAKKVEGSAPDGMEMRKWEY
ncbi:CS domain [Dillenia turbinata]|uniref:Protein SGT1 homolog n=1 Tax=Dillenia turbinata TaxID=194707 RepID=A0AAN8VMH4_9MAGN